MRRYSLVLFAVLLAPTVSNSQTLSAYPPNCQDISCNTCDPGYVRIDNSTTIGCFGCCPNCQSCQNAGPTKCDNCSQGYTLNLNSHTCEPCAANCTKCDSTGKNQCDIGSCLQGYGPGNSACQQCQSNRCSNCSQDSNSCQKCLPEFYQYSSCAGCAGYCYACPKNCSTCALNNCSTCFNSTSCTACLEGYNFDPSTNQCLAPTIIQTNSTGVILAVVFGLFLTIVGTILAYYQGKKRALAVHM